MVLVFAAAALIWFAGQMAGTPVQARLIGIGLLYVAVLALQLVLPSTHPLISALGGSFGEWASIGVLGVAIWGYQRIFTKVRAKAQERQAPALEAERSEAELERNARHIVLREIGGPGQRRLKEAKVLVIGAGGLGSPALQYLGAAGIGVIGVIDHDVVDNSNLARQVIHNDADIGMPKVFSAAKALKAQNPNITVRPYNRRLTEEIAAELVAEYDLVLDGTDNFETRYLVNAAAVTTGTPLISGALSQWEGQISIFDPAKAAPCYQCIFPEAPAPGLAPSCAEAGVLGPLPGVIGSMMAVEAIKELTGAGEGLRGRMLIYDALYGETRVIKLSRRSDCPTCGT